jgi:hypothetical protein
MTPGPRGWIVLACLALAATAALAAPGHEHHSAAGRFYQSWMMPDAPWMSCCNDEDCAPAASKFENGSWWARWSDKDPWLQVPANKVEQSKDSPDGRSHLCARPYMSGVAVLCFVRGGGV